MDKKNIKSSSSTCSENTTQKITRNNRIVSSTKINSVGSGSIRSKINLTVKENGVTSELKNFASNLNLEKNGSMHGSMPNLSITGKRIRMDKTTKLRFEYDKYLSSLEAKCALQMTEKKVTTNINEQKRVFREEFSNLKEQLENLSKELESINKLKIEKKNLDKKIELLKILSKVISSNDSLEEIMSLFTSTVSKVIVKNFEKMNESDLNAVNILLNEIIEPLKLLDYKNKISARIQLKDVLIKVAILNKELDTYKLKCEELFNKQENLENINSSLKILHSQFGENSHQSTQLLPLSHQTELKDDIKTIIDNIDW